MIFCWLLFFICSFNSVDLNAQNRGATRSKVTTFRRITSLTWGDVSPRLTTDDHETGETTTSWWLNQPIWKIQGMGKVLPKSCPPLIWCSLYNGNAVSRKSYLSHSFSTSPTVLVKLDHFPQKRDEHNKYLKTNMTPPPPKMKQGRPCWASFDWINNS